MGCLDFLKRVKRGGITFEGGPGDTVERAVIIRGAANHVAGVAAEYQHLAEKFGRRGVDWQLKTQTLLEQGGHRYDEMHIVLADGTPRTVFFDLTEFFGKW
jgi:hypothetical protein